MLFFRGSRREKKMHDYHCIQSELSFLHTKENRKLLFKAHQPVDAFLFPLFAAFRYALNFQICSKEQKIPSSFMKAKEKKAKFGNGKKVTTRKEKKSLFMSKASS